MPQVNEISWQYMSLSIFLVTLIMITSSGFLNMKFSKKGSVLNSWFFKTLN